MPTASRPCWLPSSPSSDSCLRVIAVDDMATTPPMTIAACQPTPRKIAAVAPISVVSPTCRPPAPKTVARAAIIFGSENSSPTMNIRRTTPSSERNAVPSLGARMLEAMRADREAGHEIADDRRKSDPPGEADRAGGRRR